MVARWCLAVFALLTVSTLAWGDYLLLRINLTDKYTHYPKTDFKDKGVNPLPEAVKSDSKDKPLPPLWVQAYVEIKAQPKAVPFFSFPATEVEGKSGKSIYVRSKDGKLTPAASLGKRFEDEYQNLTRNDKSVTTLLSLASWALKRGLSSKFDKVMDEAAKLDPKNAIVQIVAQVKSNFEKAPKTDDPASAAYVKTLSSQGYRSVPSKDGHYTLWTNLELTDPEIKRRLAKFERAYQTFFFWFALQGKPVPPPQHRLVVVLVKTGAENPKEFIGQEVIFDHLARLGDGFTARRENLVILSSRCLDENYLALADYNKKHLTATRDKLLGQDAKSLPAFLNAAAQAREHLNLPVWQTLSLIQQQQEDDWETATISHEATRQLIAATGLLPRNIITAEWAQFGLASFFETPPGALYPCPGAPNWMHLVDFKVLRTTGKLEDNKAKEALLNVISDRYFQEAYSTLRQAAAFTEEGDELKEKARAELTLARSTSWALIYYLAYHKEYKENLRRYLEELSALPRDLEYDEQVLVNCFARAFDLLTPDPKQPDRSILNSAPLERLANDWFRELGRTNLDIVPVQDEMLRQKLEAARSKK